MTEQVKVNFPCELIEFKMKMIRSMDREYTIVLKTDDPRAAGLSLLQPQTLLQANLTVQE